ncbi:MAG: M23 family metallopeptidase [Bacteroidota bacterium]
MHRIFLLFLFLITISCPTYAQYRLPIDTDLPNDINAIQLTEIGQFGLMRKARSTVPAHLHTGIDIKRPGKNYENEPIYPIANGMVISKRTDGPYALLIIEHPIGDSTIWIVYEHIADIQVELFQEVNTDQHIARFFNADELDKYGWHFDHFHFEILKEPPMKIVPPMNTPERLFDSYTLRCYSDDELERWFYNPIEMLDMLLTE